MDNDTLQKNIFIGLGPFLPDRRIWINQGKDRPTTPYAALSLSDQETIGEPTLHSVSADGTQEISEQKTELLTIEYYGPNSYGDLKDLKKALKTNNLRNPLAKLNIVILRSGNVLDVSGLLGTAQIEERAQLEVSILYKSTTIDTVGIIETLNIDGMLGNQPIDQTISIKD